jgi:hypothetical protein
MRAYGVKLKLRQAKPGSGGSHVDDDGNRQWSPAGSQSRPEEASHQPEASFAWTRSDPGCEA